MKQKNWKFIFVLFLLLALVLAACGGGETAEPEAPAETETEAEAPAEEPAEEVVVEETSSSAVNIRVLVITLDKVTLASIYEDGAIDKRKIVPFLRLERLKKPTRYVLNLRYAFEDQKRADDKSFVTTKDEFVGFIMGEYDVSEHFFAFGRPAMDWDTPRDIDFRVYPASGVGYRFFQKEQNFIQFPVGFGYVY